MVAEQALERRRSKVEIYLHFVWTTKYRAEVLTGELERAVHRCIVIKAQEMDCPVLAIGGTGDHVHLLLRLPTNRNVMDVVHRAKGASGRLFNSLRPPDSEPLYWQDGYG